MARRYVPGQFQRESREEQLARIRPLVRPEQRVTEFARTPEEKKVEQGEGHGQLSAEQYKKIVESGRAPHRWFLARRPSLQAYAYGLKRKRSFDGKTR